MKTNVTASISLKHIMLICLFLNCHSKLLHGQRSAQEYLNNGIKLEQRADTLLSAKNYKQADEQYSLAKKQYEAAAVAPSYQANMRIAERLSRLEEKKDSTLALMDEAVKVKERIELSHKILDFADDALLNNKNREAVLLCYLARSLIPADQDPKYYEKRFGEAAVSFTRIKINPVSTPINTIRTSPVENRMIAIAEDTILLFDLSGRIPMRSTKTNQKVILDIAFSHDGTRFATVSKGGELKIWSNNGKLLRQVQAHSLPIHSIVFSSDGKHLATGSQDKQVKIWNLQGQLVKELSGHQGAIHDLKFSRAGRWILSRGADQSILAWDWMSDQIVPIRVASADTYIYEFAIYPNKDALLYGAAERGLAFAELTSKHPLEYNSFGEETVREIHLHSELNKVISLVSSNKIWISDLSNIADHREIRLFGNATVSSVSPDGSEILAGFSEGKVELLDLQGNKLLQIPAPLSRSSVKDISFTADGHGIVVLYADGHIAYCAHPSRVEANIQQKQIQPLTKEELEKLGISQLFAEYDIPIQQ